MVFNGCYLCGVFTGTYIRTDKKEGWAKGRWISKHSDAAPGRYLGGDL